MGIHSYKSGPFSNLRNLQRRPSEMVVMSPNFIKHTYEIADFVPVENKFYEELLKEKEVNYLLKSIQPWCALITVGIGVGVLGALLSFINDTIEIHKNLALSTLLNTDFVMAHVFWASIVLIPVTLCAAGMVYVEPNAEDIGIIKTIGYMNGINLPGFTSLRTATAKCVFIMLAVTSGLPCARLEPFIHVGGLFAGSLSTLKIPFTQWRPYSAFADAIGRRDLVTAGAVAAVAVAFGTPIGAVLFCLEEGITFWNSNLTYLVFVCCVIATFTLHYIRTLIAQLAEPYLKLESYLFFSGLDELTFVYRFSDIPIFILFGVIGAGFGALWNKCYTVLFNFSKRYSDNQHFKFLESVIYGIIFLISIISLFHSMHDCVNRYEKSSDIRNSKEIKYYCNGTSFEAIGIFIFQDARNIIKSLVGMDSHVKVPDKIILCGMLYHFIFSILQFNTVLPSGILIPNLVIGASWGHLMAERFLPAVYTKTKAPEVMYTFLGALSQASGVTGFTLSLGVMLIESSGQTNYAIPVFIVVVTAKWVGGLFAEPIFRHIAYLRGYPLIRSTILPISSSFIALDVMSSPLFSLPMNINLSELLTILRENPHHFYPIMSEGKVIGVISRIQIYTILQTRTFDVPKSKKGRRELREFFSYFDGTSFGKLQEQIMNEQYAYEEDKNINFEKYITTHPYLIHQEMSLRRIYNIFLSFGAGYVIVVDDVCNAVGIITRMDIAKYRRLEQLFTIRTEVVPLL